VFFVYQRPTKKVHEFKDFSSLLGHYKDSQVANSSDLFWTLGLKTWIPISGALTDNIIKKKKYQIPSLPAEVLNDPMDIEENTQPGIINPISDEVTREIRIEESDFVIVSYEQPVSTPKDNKSFAEQRKFPRHDVRLKVIISNKEKTFLSYTVNVSIGGVMLEDKIPMDYFNSETEIFISSPKKNEFVAFRCIPVGDDKEPKRFSFGQISQTSLSKFQDWIDKLK
jgi:PilZ domain